MSRYTIRALSLCLMALALIGAYAGTPALAEVGEGPYCHHREKGSSKDDGRITEASPEEVVGEGTEQKFAGKIVGANETIIATSVQVKGITYNNADQCQGKLEIKYHGLTLSPAIANCTPVVNGNDVVKVFAHGTWKYGGIKKELEEAPRNQQKLDSILTPKELEPGSTAESLPTGLFAVISFIKSNGSACSIETVKLPVEGTVGVEGSKGGLEEWGFKEEGNVQTIAKQQYWNGISQIPFVTGLTMGGVAATYNGRLALETAGKAAGKTAAQEMAGFEK